MTSRLKVASLVGLGLATVIAAFYVGKARAAGIPDADALTYTGYLEEGAGAPLSGTFAIDVTFYGSADGDDLLCTGGVDDFELRSGRFQVPLPDCVAAIKANPNIWVDVQVDGASLSRTKLGAVPFAVEAGRATLADSAESASGALEDRLAGIEAAVPGSSLFRAWKSNAFMVPTATLQKVPFNTETYDVGAEYDPATGVFTPKAAGYYHVACKAVWHITAPATVVSYFETAIFLNDVRVQEQGHHGDGYYATRAVSGTFRLQAGDQVDCRVSHESGANRDLEVSNSRYTNFEAFKVAP